MAFPNRKPGERSVLGRGAERCWKTFVMLGSCGSFNGSADAKPSATHRYVLLVPTTNASSSAGGKKAINAPLKRYHFTSVRWFSIRAALFCTYSACRRSTTSFESGGQKSASGRHPRCSRNGCSASSAGSVEKQAATRQYATCYECRSDHQAYCFQCTKQRYSEKSFPQVRCVAPQTLIWDGD
jgi:hypothetical protein